MAHAVLRTIEIGRASNGTARRGASGLAWLVYLYALALAAIFVAGHLAYLPSTLEDIDSMNFALGLRDFDPARHQPHPPGYPIFIALGKIALRVLPAEPAALAIWGVLLGGLAALPLLQLFRSVASLDDRREQADGWAIAATALTLACPLFWFTAVRPMSDLPGLAAACAAQAWLATAFARQRTGVSGEARARPPAVDLAASGRMIVLGALASGIAIGVRSQNAWLTLPLLGLVLIDRTGRGASGAWLGSVMTFGIGVLTWAVPLVVASGGPRAYVAAVTSQAEEDLTGVDLLATHREVRRVALGLFQTFVLPWGSTALAAVVIALSVLGAFVMLRRCRAGLLLLGAATIPFGVFHLLFHETVTVRYALPLAPTLAYLACRGAASVGRWAGAVAAAALAAASLGIAMPAVKLYAAAGSPIAHALADLGAQSRASRDFVVAMHHVYARAIAAGHMRVDRVLPATPRREWLTLVNYWNAGGRRPVLFLADPARTDLTLIDYESRHALGVYRWPAEVATLMSGTRPGAVEVVMITPPGWYLEQGWSVTPETAGIAQLDRKAPGAVPIVAHVRRRPEPAVLVIGGRNLAPSGGPEARIELALDRRLIDSWIARVNPRGFLRMLTIPAGALSGAGAYASLEVSAAGVDASGAPVTVAIEQFDLQTADHIVFGFESGWHEQEYDAGLGRPWRWTSESAIVRVHHAGRDLRVRIAGESPLKYFDRAPTVVVRAGDRVLDRRVLADDFGYDLMIPEAAMAAGDGRVILQTDQTFVPAERSSSPDRRRLGLRIFTFDVRPAAAQPRQQSP